MFQWIRYSYENYLIQGRLFSFLLGQLFFHLNIGYKIFSIISVVCAIVLTTLNIMLLYNLIKRFYKNNDYLIIIGILFFTLFNFMFLANLYYFESGIMALSLVLYTLSAKYFFRNDNYSLLKSFLLNTFALFSSVAFGTTGTVSA